MSSALFRRHRVREYPLTDVSQMLQQNEIFLIGGNGFLGKVVLGMLLDRYPQV